MSVQINREELSIGAVLGLGFFWAIGPWCVLLAVITGLLWALGGAGWLGTKLWRRVGVPVAISVAVSIPLWVELLLVIATFGILCIGYGSRDETDEGSPLGNFWLNLFLNEEYAKIASRATIIGAIWLIWGIAYVL